MSDLGNTPSFDEEVQPQVDEDSIFTGGFEESELPEFASVITVRGSTGTTRYVPTTEPMTVQAVMEATDLFVAGRVEYFLDGASVQMDTVVPVDATLTVIGSVKGG